MLRNSDGRGSGEKTGFGAICWKLLFFHAMIEFNKIDKIETVFGSLIYS